LRTNRQTHRHVDWQ